MNINFVYNKRRNNKFSSFIKIYQNCFSCRLFEKIICYSIVSKLNEPSVKPNLWCLIFCLTTIKVQDFVYLFLKFTSIAEYVILREKKHKYIYVHISSRTFIVILLILVRFYRIFMQRNDLKDKTKIFLFGYFYVITDE